MKHFELTEELKVTLSGVALFRIRATVNIEKFNVEKGDLGGWVETEKNLLENAWVSGNAQVSGNARVYGNARVSGNAQVSGNARVSGNALVSGDAQVSGNARVYGDARFAKVTGLSTHTDRRSFCINMYKRGLPTLMIMSISGHKKREKFSQIHKN